MADNLVIDEGTSAKSARTDEISSNIHVPFVKIMDGTTDGTNAAIVDSSGNLQVETTNPSITGTAGSPNSALLGVQGPTAPDAAIAGYPVTVGGRVAGVTGQPTAMSADGDVVNLQLDAQGRIVPNGPVANDIAIVGNPLLIGGRAATTPQTDVNADGDAVFLRMDRHGCAFVQVHESLPAGTNAIGKLAANSGIDIGDVDVTSLPALTVDKGIQWSHVSNFYTTAQTSADIVAASGSMKFYIGRCTVTANYNTSQAGRTTVQIYFGTSTVSDSSKHVFRGTFITVPATGVESYPGAVIGTGAAPFIISAASDALKITTTTSGTHCGIAVSIDYIRV